MKKVLIAFCVIAGLSNSTNAQLNFGVKGGINYSSSAISDISKDVLDGADNKSGYHAGIWVRAKIPVLGIYIRPELVYTNIESSVNYASQLAGVIGITIQPTSYNLQILVIPVLVGKKIFGIGNVFIGPSFQYILKQDFDLSLLSEVLNDDGFTVGLQFGGGIEFGKIGIDVRWERGFSAIESTILNETTEVVKFDSRVDQVILGLSYKF